MTHRLASASGEVAGDSAQPQKQQLQICHKTETMWDGNE